MNSQKTMPYIKNSYYSTSSIPPDNLFVEAAHFIFEKNWASVRMIQLNFKVDFDTASHVINQLCAAGVLGSETKDGSRKILMTENEFQMYLNNATVTNSDITFKTVKNKLKVDPYFSEAGKFLIEIGYASIGRLQRSFKIGFNRAAEIMDQLCFAGVVSVERGVGTRTVLMSMEQFEKFLNNTELTEAISYRSSATCIVLNSKKEFSFNGVICDYSHSGQNLLFLKNLIVTHASQDYQLSFINKLLKENSPEDLSIILSDLSLSGYEIYNDVPNLLIPVISNIDKTFYAIDWLLSEAKSRTTLFLKQNARNIDIYNQYSSKKLSKIVYIVDEIFYLQNSFEKSDSLISLLLNCNRMGIYILFFSKFNLKNLSLGKIKDLITIYNEKLPFETNFSPQVANEKYINNFDAMEGIEFEFFCQNILQKNGFRNLKTTKGSGDQGIDLLAEKDGIQYGIQCKCYSSDVGNKAVQEAFAGKTFYGCHVAVVLTNRHFTKSAVELAQVNKVLLWDREKLNALIKSAK